jgi:hypothetical protein
MGIRKAKDALKKAQAESPNDRRLLSKLKKDVSKKRADSQTFKPSFDGQHRGY